MSLSCSNPNSLEVKAVQAAYPNLSLMKINEVHIVYSTFYKTDSFPNIDNAGYTQSQTEASRLMTPFSNNKILKDVSSLIGVEYDKSNLNTLAVLYKDYRSTLSKDHSENPAILSTLDIDNFKSWLISDTNSKAVELLGLKQVDPTNSVMDRAYVIAALEKNNPNLHQGSILKAVHLLSNPMTTQLFYKDSFDMYTDEGRKKLYELGKRNDVVILDKNGVPKIYDSVSGPYFYTSSLKKQSILNLGNAFNPAVTTSIFGEVVSRYLKDTTSNKNIARIYSDFMHDALDIHAINNQMNVIASNNTQIAKLANPALKGSLLAKAANALNRADESYKQLSNLLTIGRVVAESETVRDMLYTNFKQRLKNVGFEINSEVSFENEYSIREELDDDAIQTAEVTAGDQFGTTFDELNPSMFTNALVKPIFMSIVKQEDGIEVMSKYFPGVTEYEDANMVEFLVLNTLAGTYLPSTRTNTLSEINEDVELDIFQMMYDKLADTASKSKNYMLNQVLNNLDAIIEKEESEEKQEDIKRAFVNSFSIMQKDYLMSIVETAEMDKNTSDGSLSTSYYKLISNTYDKLSDLTSVTLSTLMDAINPKYVTETGKGANKTKVVDIKSLIKASEAMRNINLDRAAKSKEKSTEISPQELTNKALVSKHLSDFFGFKFTDFEIESIVDKSKGIATELDTIKMYNGNGREQTTFVAQLSEYVNTTDPSLKKNIGTFLSDKGGKTILTSVVDVLARTRELKTSNTYVVGNSMRYGYTEPSWIARLIGEINNGNVKSLEQWQGQYNIFAEYLSGQDLQDALPYDIDQSIAATTSADNTTMKRQRSIKYLDNTAIKANDDNTVSTSDASFTDRLITTYLKFTNNDNSFNKYSTNNVDSTIGIMDTHLAADGAATSVITGLVQNDTSLPIKQRDFYKVSVEQEGNIKAAFSEIQKENFKVYTRYKIGSVFTEIANATKLIDAYYAYDVMSELEVNKELLRKYGNIDFTGKSIEFKRNHLMKAFAMDNFKKGYHYDTDKGSKVDLAFGGKLTYANFLLGTYHRGGHLNDVLVKDRETTEKYAEERKSRPANSYAIMDYDYSKGSPRLTEEAQSSLNVLIADTNIDNRYPTAFKDPIISSVFEKFVDVLDNMAEKEFDKIKNIPIWTAFDNEAKDESGKPGLVTQTVANLVLDNMHLAKFSDAKGDRTEAIKAYWKNFIISATMHNTEFIDFASGNIAHYKQPKDGRTLNTTELNKCTYASSKEVIPLTNLSGMNSQKMTTHTGRIIPFNLNKVTSIAIYDDIEGLESKHIDKIRLSNPEVKSYDKNNVTYGQSFITPEYFAFLNKHVKGDWSTYDDMMCLELSNPNVVLRKEHFKWLKKSGRAVSANSSKWIGFDLNDVKKDFKLNEDDGFTSNDPTVIKTNLFVLFPAMIKGTPIEQLVKAMNVQGVQILSAKSSIKSYSIASTQIHKTTTDSKGRVIYDTLREYNSDPLTEKEGTFRLNPFFIATTSLGKEQNIPSNGIYEAEVPKQMMRNLVSNLDVKSTEKSYFFDGSMYTANELFRMITNTYVDLVQSQTTKFASQIYENGIIKNEKKLRNLILSQLDPLNQAEEIAIIKDTSIPVTTLVGSNRWIQPLIARYIEKKVSQANTNKMSTVQVANIGFNELSKENKNDIFFFSEDRELSPPIPITLGTLDKATRDKLDWAVFENEFIGSKEYNSVIISLKENDNKSTDEELEKFVRGNIQNYTNDNTSIYFTKENIMSGYPNEIWTIS